MAKAMEHPQYLVIKTLRDITAMLDEKSQPALPDRADNNAVDAFWNIVQTAHENLMVQLIDFSGRHEDDEPYSYKELVALFDSMLEDLAK